MAKKIETIDILVSGSDAPGTNVAIRTVVRAALHYGTKVKGVVRGYSDLLDEELIDMSARSVTDIINRGGIILYTVRCMEAVTEEGQRQAAEICRKHGIDGVMVIGDDGSFKDAGKLSKLGINTTGMSGTIGLDTACIEYTIGLDTTVNIAIGAIDEARDTSTSHERCSIIEVMGRRASYIVLWSGIVTDSNAILIPEHYDSNEQGIINHIITSRKRSRKHFIITNAEGMGHLSFIAKYIEAAAGIETRTTILGYMQRGSSPSCKDRFYASITGSKAASLLTEGKLSRLVAYRNSEFYGFDIEEAFCMKRDIPAYQLELPTELTR